MSSLGKVIYWQTTTGTPIAWRDGIVTPQWQTIAVRLPSAWFAWQRPVAVLVEQRDGRTMRKPIVDVTRLLRVGLPVVALTVRFVIRRSTEKRRSQSENNARQVADSKQER